MLAGWQITAAVALGSAVVSFGAGWQVRSWKAGSEQSQALTDAAKKLKDAAAQMHHASELYEAESEAGRQAGITRETELRTIYHETTVPADCAAPDAARSVLQNGVDAANARAGGGVVSGLPEATGPADPAH